jgi:uncharacterized protein with NAD-binding domain and iron-sulfur cluster
MADRAGAAGDFFRDAEETAKRPPARTRFRNLVLAGDWTRTGLPSTIEGSIRSGVAAATAITSAAYAGAEAVRARPAA